MDGTKQNKAHNLRTAGMDTHKNYAQIKSMSMSLHFPPFPACDRAKYYNCPPDYITVYTQPDYYIIKIKFVILNAIKACIYRLNSF